MEALVSALEEYIRLLEDECGGLYSFAGTHGYVCPEDKVKHGQELREQIARLKSEHIK